MNSKKIINPIIVFVLCSTLSIAQQKTVTILYTNDIESVYEPVEAFWNDSINYIGGIPYLAGLINIVQKRKPQSFLFDAGDIYTGALSAATEGILPFKIYNTMGYDAIALGNHEFEYGKERLAYTKQRANFPVLNCNIFYENTNIHYCQSYTILEKNSVKIGLIGVMGLEAFKNTINPVHREGLVARDPYPIVQNIINDIREEVDLVVLLTHQNQSAPMQTDKEADPEVQRGFDEDYAMAGNIKGIDLIIGGHSDNGLWEPVKHPDTGTLICLTFGQGKYLGYLSLAIDTEKKDVSLLEGRLIPVNVDSLQPNEQVSKLIRQTRNEHPELIEVIGQTKKSAFRKYYKESTLGNLLADFLKDASGADIGLINSGSIRADLNAGEITQEDIINIYPFIGKFNVVEIDGSALVELLEYSYQLTYGFVQQSGLTAKYNSAFPQGKRLIEVKLNGKDIEPTKKYTVACSAFLANGGDGFTMLKEGKLIRESEKKMMDYFIEQIKLQKDIIVPPVGRQVDISKNIILPKR